MVLKLDTYQRYIAEWYRVAYSSFLPRDPSEKRHTRAALAYNLGNTHGDDPSH